MKQPRKWKISKDAQGQLGILGPPLESGDKLFVVEMKALLEMMTIIDRHMVRLGGKPPYANLIKDLTEDMPEYFKEGLGA